MIEDDINLIASRLRGGVVDKPTALKQLRILLAGNELIEIILGLATRNQDSLAAVQRKNATIALLQAERHQNLTSVHHSHERTLNLERAITNILREAQNASES